MKTEKFEISDKSEIFSKADSMHDCSFSCSFQDNTLSLIFNNLEQYYDEPPITPWFGEYKKLTINYSNINCLNLSLKRGKREKNYYDTVVPLENCELTMFKYSIDSFDSMTLDFYVTKRKKIWGGIIEIYPKNIEYIWE